MSPLIQTAALAAAGLDVSYGRYDVPPERLDDALAELAQHCTGGNVTMPHKEAVHAACARRTVLAERVGAVNTFWFEAGALCGHNTDVAGVQAAIKALYPDGVHTRRVTVLGAGGSAAAALVALDLAGCQEIVMCARTEARGRAVAERVEVSVRHVASPDAAVQGAALVINATPLGMRDDAMPVQPALMDADAAVLDLVYRADETAWVRGCRARGLRAEDGLRMLVEQGAEAFRVWFDREPLVAAMWDAIGASMPSCAMRAARESALMRAS